MITKALYPLMYLRIKHPQKRAIDWIYPALLAIVTVGLPVITGLHKHINLYGSEGVINYILGYVQTLPGFYIAALAAISTFNKNDMDRLMPNPAPTLNAKIRGKIEIINLTRRKFLSAMFSFLTAESILITMICIVSISINKALFTITPIYWHGPLKAGIVFIILFLIVSQLEKQHLVL